MTFNIGDRVRLESGKVGIVESANEHGIVVTLSRGTHQTAVLVPSTRLSTLLLIMEAPYGKA